MTASDGRLPPVPGVREITINDIEVGEKISTNIEHCTADILFEWFGFNQTCKSVDNFN